MCLNVHLKTPKENPNTCIESVRRSELFDLLWPRPHRVCLLGADKGFITQTHPLKSNMHTCLCEYISQSFTHKPCTHSVHVPAQLAIGIAVSANVLLWSLEKHEKQKKIRHHMLFLAKPYKVKVWHSDGSYAG